MAADAASVELLVFHGSPDAPAVDIVVRGLGTVLDDFAFGSFSDGYLAVPPAAYELDIETADNAVTAASFAADLSGAAGAAVSVLASGFLAPASDADPGFGLLAVFADGTTALLPALDESVTFSLIDAATDTAIPAFDPMPQGAMLDLSALPSHVNIRANIAGDAASVRFDLNDMEGVRVESFAPYALCGDIEGDYLSCHLPVGTHTVTATAFSEGGASGEMGAMGALTFSVVNNGNTVTSFVLVDADTDEDLFVLEDGMSLNLGELPANLNVRAETGDKVRSVFFELNTSYDRTENVAPFALWGDLEGDYLPGTFAEGENVLSATPYSATRKEGEAGTGLSITLDVSGESAGKTRVISGSFEEAVAEDALSLSAEEGLEQPGQFVLGANYPNPFNPTTAIRFTLAESAQIQLTVYDMLGRQVRVLLDGTVSAGENEVVFDAAGLPTGTYLYRLTTPQGSVTKKMMLLK